MVRLCGLCILEGVFFWFYSGVFMGKRAEPYIHKVLLTTFATLDPIQVQRCRVDEM